MDSVKANGRIATAMALRASVTATVMGKAADNSRPDRAAAAAVIVIEASRAVRADAG
jgi:hypothetical protein